MSRLEREFFKVTERLVAGERVGYWCIDRREATNVFRDYVAWLKKLGITGWSARKSDLSVRLDCGEVRFISWAGQSDGVKAFYTGPYVLDDGQVKYSSCNQGEEG